LNNVVTGCILLGGLFFYDIFWVFGTNVMVTVAKSFEAPIKCERKVLETPFIKLTDYFAFSQWSSHRTFWRKA
jgi:Signal peptide peptidase